MKFVLLLLCLSSQAFAYKHEVVVSGQEIIWGMEVTVNEILFTERRGRLKAFDFKTKKVREIPGTPKVYARGQGGLLDITLHPNFAKNKRVYLTYAKSLKEAGKRTTALGYGIYDGKKLNDFKEIFVAKGESSARHHFGSRVVFDENNHLYLSVGDRGERPSAQDLGSHFGSVMKMTDEGEALKDNPFVSDKKALDEIWSYGHRNPQGLFYDKETKSLYEIEHGPRGGDEINLIKKGQNYGWPIVSHGKEYVLPAYVGDYREKHKNMVDSIKYYVPSIAPSDLVLYRGDIYPGLKGKLITGALAQTHINVYDLKSKKELKLFDDEDFRVRSLAVSSDGTLYFGSDDGNIRKLLK